MDLLAKKKKLLDSQEALLNLASEEGRALTAEEQKTFDGYEEEIVNIEATLERKKLMEDKIKEKETVVTPKLDAIARSDKPIWNHPGEFFQAVAKATKSGVYDKRLVNAATGANEGVGSEGGFLVDTQFASVFLEKMHEQSQVASRVFSVPIGEGFNGLKMNGYDETSRVNGSRFGGVQAYWAAEAGTVTATKPTFKKTALDLEKLMAFYYATDEILQDSTALGALVEKAFVEEMAFKVDDAYINGTGGGIPLGILKSGALVSVAKESGQAADTILGKNVMNMWSRLWAKSRANAVWYINQDTEPQLMTMSIPVGTGGIPIYMPANGLSGQPYATLMGRPVLPIEQCATVGDLGDIVLADMSQYLEIDKGGVDKKESIHVRFLYDESCFRFVYRVNGVPMWDKALTPYKGSNTLSPFVALAARA